MAVSRCLRKLLRILEIEEEQGRLAVESAQGELGRLERSLIAVHEWERRGRQLVVASARSGELTDRLAGVEETRAARRRIAMLKPRIADAEAEVTALRQAYLAKRVERRQTDTLIGEAEAKDAVVAGRRGQQSLDNWYLNRRHAARPEGRADGAASGTDYVDETQ